MRLEINGGKMKAEIEIPDAFSSLKEISQLLKEILQELQASRYINSNQWLNATDFCEKYNISRPTLYKRVKAGEIEILNFGGQANRYRLKKEIFEESGK